MCDIIWQKVAPLVNKHISHTTHRLEWLGCRWTQETMREPSSSEEESENETNDDDNSDILSIHNNVDQKSLSASGENLTVVSHGRGPPRPASPSPSLISDREKTIEDTEKLEREEEERKKRLQLYVFVMRCIAYPFNAKQPTDMARRQTKVTKQQLQTIKERFLAFLNGETSIVADEAFTNAVQSYYEVFLKSDRVATMVKSGGCSANDFREVFKNNIEKRVRSLPEIDGLSKETVLSSWMTKFDAIFRGEEDPRKQPQRMSTAASELILSKEQLYDMFQNILGVKKYEHQILYNACQVRFKDSLCYPHNYFGSVEEINLTQRGFGLGHDHVCMSSL